MPRPIPVSRPSRLIEMPIPCSRRSTRFRSAFPIAAILSPKDVRLKSLRQFITVIWVWIYGLNNSDTFVRETINEGNSLTDIRCRRFSDILRTKEDHYPYSDKYISEVHDSSTKTGRTEREHMVEWFRANETKGSGSYSRQTPNSSARRCYNSLMNAASLLWIAEAAGIDKLTVRRAYEAAVAAGDYRRACGVPSERSSPGIWCMPAYKDKLRAVL